MIDFAFVKGVYCQAWLSGELFLQCYAKNSPAEDVMQCICRSAFLVRQILFNNDRILKVWQSYLRKGVIKMPSLAWTKWQERPYGS